MRIKHVRGATEFTAVTVPKLQNADERTLPIRDYTAGLRVTCPGAPQDSVSCSNKRRKLYPVEKNLSVAFYTSSVTLCLGSSKFSTSIH